jgi:hypothetical protein
VCAHCAPETGGAICRGLGCELLVASVVVRSERCPLRGSSLFSGQAFAQGCLQIDLVFLLVDQNSANVLGYRIFSYGLALA